MRDETLAQAKRIVVKIGSALLTGGGRGLDRAAITQWVAQIASIRKRGTSSGAARRTQNGTL